MHRVDCCVCMAYTLLLCLLGEAVMRLWSWKITENYLEVFIKNMNLIRKACG